MDMSALSPEAIALLGSGLRRRPSAGVAAGHASHGEGGGAGEAQGSIYAPAAVWKGMVADAVDEDMNGRAPGPDTKW
jgi:hypothetical protein